MTLYTINVRAINEVHHINWIFCVLPSPSLAHEPMLLTRVCCAQATSWESQMTDSGEDQCQ